ncbi:MAG: hypothetical protein KKD05_09630 [Candidatus Omnitrophica bacterium]|nr:hypothetical protein [Candidatus Omnitrophota bacterium]
MKQKTAQGFILIEILVSVMVFSVGVLFLVQTLSQITKSNQHISDNYNAMLLIDNLLNRLSSQEVLAASGTEPIQDKAFAWQIDYSNSLEGLKQVILRVTWQTKAREYSAELKHKLIVLE